MCAQRCRHQHDVVGGEAVHLRPSSAALEASAPGCAATPFGSPLEPEVSSTSGELLAVGPPARVLAGASTGQARRRGSDHEVRARAGPACVDLGRPAEVVDRRGDRRRAASRPGTAARPRQRLATATRRRRRARTPRARSPPASARHRSPCERVRRRGRAARRATAGPRPHPASSSTSVRGRRSERGASTASGFSRQSSARLPAALAGVGRRSTTLLPMKLSWVSMVPAPMHSPRMSRYARSTRVLAGVAVAAEELDRLVAHELGGEVGGGLGHRGLERGRGAAGAGQVHGPPEQQPGALRARSPCRRASTADPGATASGLPPITRSFMYRTAYSSAPWAAPTHIAALPQRSWLRWREQRLERLAVRRVARDEHVVGLDRARRRTRARLRSSRARPSKVRCR